MVAIMSRNIQTLRVPCALLSVDSPNRREILKDGVPKQLNENILGHGSYGTVIKAIYKGKHVAVKIIDKLSDLKMSTIQNESNIIGWHHENIIKILKIDSGPRQAVVIMERFPGQCLQHILEKMELPLFHIIRICADISNGLSYCHEQGLLHLDIKPKNILVAMLKVQESDTYRAYRCKLCDFGSSTFITKLNTKLAARGTIRYMAPELLNNEKASNKVDIYSLGITMWQVKSGRNPYFWIAENEVVAYKVIKENLRPDFKSQHSKTGLLTSSCENNCLCTHFGSMSNLPDPLIENINPLTLSDKNYSSASPVKNTAKPNRIPFARLNNQINFQISSSTNQSPQSSFLSYTDKFVLPKQNVLIKINSTTREDDESIKSVFRKRAELNKKKTEAKYEDLFKRCWDNDPRKRPASSNVLQSLKVLLKEFK